MSTREIIAELPQLKPDELALVKAKLEEVLEKHAKVRVVEGESDDFLLRLAGTAEGLPPDLAENHDYYLYGAARRTRS